MPVLGVERCFVTCECCSVEERGLVGGVPCCSLRIDYCVHLVIDLLVLMKQCNL